MKVGKAKQNKTKKEAKLPVNTFIYYTEMNPFSFIPQSNRQRHVTHVRKNVVEFPNLRWCARVVGHFVPLNTFSYKPVKY